MPRPVSNPPNPWASSYVEWLEEPPPATIALFEEEARSVLSENESPDLSFRFSVNPYRGCLHACAYCYARPSHQYLGWGAGTDFDRKIVIKTNAPEVLRRELMRPSWTGETIVFSGNTDCYQAVEATYALTRQCLQVCAEFRNPVSVITKSALVRRDRDVLAELARTARVAVTFSIAFADDETARALEPHAARPSRRFEAMAELSAAGIPTGLALAPVIPGLNDAHIPNLLERAKQAGARRAFMLPLRLPSEVLPVFEQRLQEALPLRAAKIRRAVHEMRGGTMNEPAFGARFRGRGARWEAVSALFALHCRKLGLAHGPLTEDLGAAQEPAQPTTFRRPSKQGTLFDL